MVGKRLVIDANIFLEALLNQERASECAQFLAVLSEQSDMFVAVSAFCLFTIGVRLERAGELNGFTHFLNDCQEMEVEIYQPNILNQKEILDICSKYKLDFDDAQQYLAAKELNASLVSFDKDFDKTDIKRVEPAELLTNL